jgi:hypothetical protein
MAVMVARDACGRDVNDGTLGELRRRGPTKYPTERRISACGKMKFEVNQLSGTLVSMVPQEQAEEQHRSRFFGVNFCFSGCRYLLRYQDGSSCLREDITLGLAISWEMFDSGTCRFRRCGLGMMAFQVLRHAPADLDSQ